MSVAQDLAVVPVRLGLWFWLRLRTWLLDAIASYQPQILKDPTLQQFQHCKLTVHPDQKATLVCERDLDDVVVTQEIAYTDFGLWSVSVPAVLERGKHRSVYLGKLQ